jgi:hypothetical protein
MKRLLSWILGVMALVGALASTAFAAGLPAIQNTTVDYRPNALTITGQNFGARSASFRPLRPPALTYGRRATRSVDRRAILTRTWSRVGSLLTRVSSSA